MQRVRRAGDRKLLAHRLRLRVDAAARAVVAVFVGRRLVLRLIRRGRRGGIGGRAIGPIEIPRREVGYRHPPEALADWVKLGQPGAFGVGDPEGGECRGIIFEGVAVGIETGETIGDR